MRFESGETRQHTKSDKQQAPQDTFASSERAIFGLSGEFTIELQGSLRGLVEDARHEHERMIADKRLQSGSDMLLASGATSADLSSLEALVRTGDFILPAGVTKKDVLKTIGLKRKELEKREEEERVAAQLKRIQDRRKALEKRERYRKIGISLGAVASASAIGIGISEGVGAVQDHFRNQAIAYEQSHELTTEPTAFSFSGWRVRESSVAPDSELNLVPLREVEIPPVSELDTLKVVLDDQEIDTGIEFATYETTAGSDVPQIKIRLDDSNAPDVQEQLLTEGFSHPHPTNLIELENRDGREITVQIQSAETSDGTDVFVATPVRPDHS